MWKRRAEVKIFFIEKKWWAAAACLVLAAVCLSLANRENQAQKNQRKKVDFPENT